MFEQFSLLMDRLQQADFLTLVLEPLFFYGIFFGLISFCVGFFMGDARCRLIGLAIIALSCFATYPYLKLREKASPRITAVSDAWHNSKTKTQHQRRVSYRWVFYATGWIAVVAAISSGSSVKFVSSFMIVASFITLFFGLWLHLKESEIYHPYITPSIKEKAAR